MGLEHLTCVWGSLDGPELTALCVQNFYFWGTDLRNKRVNNTHRIQKETQLKKKHMMFEAEGTHPFFEKKCSSSLQARKASGFRIGWNSAATWLTQSAKSSRQLRAFPHLVQTCGGTAGQLRSNACIRNVLFQMRDKVWVSNLFLTIFLPNTNWLDMARTWYFSYHHSNTELIFPQILGPATFGSITYKVWCVVCCHPWPVPRALWMHWSTDSQSWAHPRLLVCIRSALIHYLRELEAIPCYISIVT